MNRKLSVWERLKAYKLNIPMWIAVIMLLIFCLSILAYQIPALRENDIASNILLALFTSLLVTVFTMAAEILVSYQRHKNDDFLESLYDFGIMNLHQDKKEALKVKLEECDSMIWISGYRLILTHDLIYDFKEAILRGADLVAVICPPWSKAFKMVYGDNEKVADHYLAVFDEINQARIQSKKAAKEVEVVFVDKPIFSDTYRIDQNLITGPFMHNKDERYNRLMAKDFFSYNVVRKSKLYTIIETEYKTLYEEAKWRLNWDRFEEINDQIENGDMNEAEKNKLLAEACDPIKPEK